MALYNTTCIKLNKWNNGTEGSPDVIRKHMIMNVAKGFTCTYLVRHNAQMLYLKLQLLKPDKILKSFNYFGTLASNVGPRSTRKDV